MDVVMNARSIFDIRLFYERKLSKNWRCELLIPSRGKNLAEPPAKCPFCQNIYCNPPKSLAIYDFCLRYFCSKNHFSRPRFGVVSLRHRKTTLFKNSQALSCLGKHHVEAKNGNLSPCFACCVYMRHLQEYNPAGSWTV